ncbi:Alpha/Beta hydrolase protein [Aspergillus granulosus]|uniref:Alpha/Beta hydrolase protein n=1 Tax=Aspergillus granulosus TaxID=176169 RepID=A0ABR4GV05_9EURO
MPQQYDSEFAAAAGPTLAQYAALGSPPIHDVESRRSRFQSALKKNANFPIPDELESIVHTAPAADGHEVEIYHVRTRRPHDQPQPAVVHIHGGGYMSFSAAHSIQSLVDYVSRSGVQMLSIEYRLAPENPFPIPLEDCWSALQWIISNGSALNIDPARIAIMGESAGGGLAANLTLLARDRGLSPPLAKQILIYPMLDDRTNSDTTDGLAFFDVSDCITGWAAYLGKDVLGTSRVPKYAAAARNENLDGLPELYMECPQLDILLPENLHFLSRFVAAKIRTEFHLYGLPHGFTSLAPSVSWSQRAIENRVRAIVSF